MVGALSVLVWGGFAALVAPSHPVVGALLGAAALWRLFQLLRGR